MKIQDLLTQKDSLKEILTFIIDYGFEDTIADLVSVGELDGITEDQKDDLKKAIYSLIK